MMTGLTLKTTHSTKPQMMKVRCIVQKHCCSQAIVTLLDTIIDFTIAHVCCTLSNNRRLQWDSDTPIRVKTLPNNFLGMKDEDSGTSTQPNAHQGKPAQKQNNSKQYEFVEHR